MNYKVDNNLYLNKQVRVCRNINNRITFCGSATSCMIMSYIGINRGSSVLGLKTVPLDSVFKAIREIPNPINNKDYPYQIVVNPGAIYEL